MGLNLKKVAKINPLKDLKYLKKRNWNTKLGSLHAWIEEPVDWRFTWSINNHLENFLRCLEVNLFKSSILNLMRWKFCSIQLETQFSCRNDINYRWALRKMMAWKKKKSLWFKINLITVLKRVETKKFKWCAWRLDFFGDNFEM